MDVIHGKGYSLLQKVMFARQQGEEKITLYLEDAERILEKEKQFDMMIVELMEYAPTSLLERINKELFDE